MEGQAWEAPVEQMYKEMYPALYVYALRILEDAALAEEAIQEAFCIACAKREQVLASANPQGWIMCTLKHVMRNMILSRSRLRALLQALEERAGPPAGTEELASVDVLFGDVSDSEDFRLLKRIALDRCTVLEVAEDLGISVESCKKRVQRARKRLQGKMTME